MPFITDPQFSRRRFLKTSLVAGAATLTLRSALSAADDSCSLRLALLSDTHIPHDPANGYRGFSPIDNLKQVLPQVLKSKPEGMIINGDAARLTGEIADYKKLKELIQPVSSIMPVYIVMGNHDDRGHFAQVMDTSSDVDASVQGKHVLVMEHAAVRVVILDSLLYVDKVAGLLGKTQREWLASFLESAEKKPTVFFVHHSLGDSDGDLLDVDRFFKILEPHSHVKAVFYGHSHRFHFTKYKHIHLINLPAVGYNFSDSEPVGWVDGEFTHDGVHLTLNAIAGNQNQNGKTIQLNWS